MTLFLTLFLTLLLILLFTRPLSRSIFPVLFLLKGKMRRRAPWFAFFRGFCEKRQTQCNAEGAKTRPLKHGIMLDVFRKRREKHQAKACALRIFFRKNKRREKKCFGIRGA
ncbi:MAG: hypothetical protein H7829_09670 [Magnetococcus sp. THC-1_WYH]